MKTIREAGLQGPFIQTLTGPFNFFAHDTMSIDLKAIARSLGATVRYRGLTHQFYSVAWHSLFGAMLIEKLFPNEWVEMGVMPSCIPETDEDCNAAALHFLLHDAPEAFIGDIPAPLKQCLRVVDPQLEAGWTEEAGFAYACDELQSVQDLEDDINGRIYSHLGLPEPTQPEQNFIKYVDQIMFMWEVSWLFGVEDLLEIMASGFGVRDVAVERIHVSIRSVSQALREDFRQLYSSTLLPVDSGREAWLAAVESLREVTDTTTDTTLPLELTEESQ